MRTKYHRRRSDLFLIASISVIVISCGTVIIVQTQVFPSLLRVSDVAPSPFESSLDGSVRAASMTLQRSPIRVTPRFVGPLMLSDSKGNVNPPFLVWAHENGVDILKNGFADEDLDGDLFSTFEEWENGKTHPKNNSEHPPLGLKLRFVKRVEDKTVYPLFAAKNSEDIQVKIGQKSYFPKIGDTIANRFRIDSLKDNVIRRGGIEFDASELNIFDKMRKESVTLILGKPYSKSEYSAILVLRGDEPFYIEQGKTFTRGDETISYQLKELNENSATIEYLWKGEKRQEVVKQ